MADPYAPPQDSPGRPARPAPVAEQAYPEAYQAPVRETYRERERPWRRHDAHDEPRAEPAHLGLFWTVAAVGIGFLALARLMLFFVLQDNLPGEQVASALFATLGVIALSLGLCLAGLLQRGLATPWRIALMIGAGFFAVAGAFPFNGIGALL